MNAGINHKNQLLHLSSCSSPGSLNWEGCGVMGCGGGAELGKFFCFSCGLESSCRRPSPLLFVTRPQICPIPCTSTGDKSAPGSSGSHSARPIPVDAGLNRSAPLQDHTTLATGLETVSPTPPDLVNIIADGGCRIARCSVPLCLRKWVLAEERCSKPNCRFAPK